MELFQWGLNPWGQQILIRISWDLLWASAAAGAGFVLLHLLTRRFWFPRQVAEDEAAPAPSQVDDIPERVPRHSMASRLFHWLMAAAMLVLLFTGFLPVVGVQFGWVTIHWVAGVLLILSIVFHMFHSLLWLEWRAVWIDSADVRSAWRRLSRGMGGSGPAPEKPGKYPLENKIYHHITSLTSFAVMGTGILMMFRIETWLWGRNPYLLADQSWGIVYVLHGLASVALVALVMAHVYFAILPEKRWITWSMIVGWISRKDYLRHHDPERWAPSRRR